jgi:hypothetical protein
MLAAVLITVLPVAQSAQAPSVTADSVIPPTGRARFANRRFRNRAQRAWSGAV